MLYKRGILNSIITNYCIFLTDRSSLTYTVVLHRKTRLGAENLIVAFSINRWAKKTADHKENLTAVFCGEFIMECQNSGDIMYISYRNKDISQQNLKI